MLGDLSEDKCFRALCGIEALSYSAPGTREEALNSLYSIQAKISHVPRSPWRYMVLSGGALKPNATASPKPVKKWNKKTLLAGKSPKLNYATKSSLVFEDHFQLSTV